MLDELRCRDILPDLSLYIDQEASAMLCEEIERHLAHCDNCRVVVDTLRRTVSLYQTLLQPELPDHLRERLYRTFQLEEFLTGRRPTVNRDNEDRRHE